MLCIARAPETGEPPGTLSSTALSSDGDKIFDESRRNGSIWGRITAENLLRKLSDYGTQGIARNEEMQLRSASHGFSIVNPDHLLKRRKVGKEVDAVGGPVNAAGVVLVSVRDNKKGRVQGQVVS